MKLKSLKLLIKLKKQELDDKRKNLADYQENLLKLEQSMNELSIELQREQQIIDQDNLLSSFYNNYYLDYRNKKDLISNEIIRFNNLISDIEEEIITDFADIKKYEIILNNYIVKKQITLEQKKQQLLDEIILNKFQQ